MVDDSTSQGAEPDDGELLHRYAVSRCEDAFATLVRRHLTLVYNVALRKVGGDTHLAEDVAQRVFTDLATKAATLRRHPGLAGWLFTGTHYAAAQLVRTERRRRNREQKAQAMKELFHESTATVEWERLRPLLDDLVLELPPRDREAVLLRYFEGRPFSEVGARLRLTEAGARARVDRAVEKLGAKLSRRGITSMSTALALALAQQAGVAAPAGLAASVTGAAFAASTTNAVLAAGVFGFMSTAKLMTVAATVVAIGAIGFGLAQRSRSQATTRELAAARLEVSALTHRLARAEQRAQQTATPTAAKKEELPRENPPSTAKANAAPPEPAAIAPNAPLAAPKLEATKDALARVVSQVGKVDLEPEHIANVRAWVEQDAPGLIRWIATLPSSKQREHTLEAVIAIETETNPDLAFLLANNLERERPRMNRLGEVVRAWAARNPQAAAEAVAKADLSDDNRARLNRFIERSTRPPSP